MSFEAFLKVFGNVSICHLTSTSFEPLGSDRTFDVFSFIGAWVKGVNAGGCLNHGLGRRANPCQFINNPIIR
jgi:hypothetical protein